VNRTEFDQHIRTATTHLKTAEQELMQAEKAFSGGGGNGNVDQHQKQWTHDVYQLTQITNSLVTRLAEIPDLVGVGSR